MRSAIPGTAASFEGATISYRDFGGTGPALVLLPGWACAQVMWDAAAAHLAERFRVVTLDFIGFGASAAGDRQWTMENFARDVRVVLEALELSAATLVGHSMGGAVALEAAYLCPERVVRVIGADTFTYLGFYERLDERLMDETMAPFRTDCAGTIRGFMPAYLGPDIDPVLAAHILDMLAEARPACAVPAIECLFRWDIHTSLSRCTVPVATINAAKFVTDDARRRLADRIDIRTLDRVGHFLMMERPDAFAAAVAAVAAQ